MDAHPPLGELIATFTPDPNWGDSRGALGMCQVAAWAFARHAARYGYTAQVLSIYASEHSVALVDGTTVDYTARQFDPDNSFPQIMPYALEVDDEVEAEVHGPDTGPTSSWVARELSSYEEARARASAA